MNPTIPTPRTDAAMVDCHGVPLHMMHDDNLWYVKASFARQLERELAEANARAEKWEKVADMFRIPLFEGAANTYAAIAAYDAAKEEPK